MSYTPKIFVDYNDLKKLDETTELLKDYYTWFDDSTDEGKALKEIRWVYFKEKPIKFKGLEFVILTAEYSSECLAIREYLKKLGIDFALSY